ncbi:MAG TPA: Gfo/Idh/MocA family oxidoreductase [Clostridia bacterium]|nr:Gfo/Idh/MocA family oxidoreductase [Clostridia bacterium]
MDRKIRWGILGAGSIAHKFATGFGGVGDGELYAVGSRSIDKADEFANEYDIPKRYGSYDELLLDSDVDAIYVATPHPFHKEHTLLCLNAGKAVLCEKPMAVNAAEVEEMVECARKNNVFLMEAMWTRFLPVYCQVEEWLDQGLIGDVRILTGDFGFRAGVNPEARLFNPALAGGALMDVGVYLVSLASLIMKKPPSNIVSMAHLGETGIDEQASMILGYDEGQMAVLYTAIRTNTKHEARIIGTEGSIYIPSFWNTTTAVLQVNGQEDKVVDIPHLANGYCFEIKEVNRCIKEGKIQSDRMPWDESISVIKTLDDIRAQWGLKYPME